MANWIAKAVKHPGSFTRSAKRAGEGVQAYARTVLKKGSRASATTKRRARLAQTFRKLASLRK
jgi:hypothetical protein